MLERLSRLTTAFRVDDSDSNSDGSDSGDSDSDSGSDSSDGVELVESSVASTESNRTRHAEGDAAEHPVERERRREGTPVDEPVADEAPVADAAPQQSATRGGRVRERRPVAVRFWVRFARETLGGRRLAPLVRARLRDSAVSVEGVEHLPATGTFVLAANHYRGRAGLDVVAALLAGAHHGRPDLDDAWLLISGKRQRSGRPRATLGAPLRGLLGMVFRRWSPHVVRIPLNGHGTLAGLREWRERAHRQPCLVFPEGKARERLGPVRPGAGRWLASLGVPEQPAGVWWEDGRPVVRFGPAVAWDGASTSRDAQLRAAIAALLPQELRPIPDSASVRRHAPAIQPARRHVAVGSQLGVP